MQIPNPLVFYSGYTLEHWDHSNPFKKGIGGSETSHIELSERAGDLNQFPVLSFVPKESIKMERYHGLHVYSSKSAAAHLNRPTAATWLVYRDVDFFKQELPPQNKYWFMAQDVGYALTEEMAKPISRYICLCPEHANYTAEKYPFLKDKICLSSNGVRATQIKYLEASYARLRNPKSILYASSPDRGLQLILENWFRVREVVPDAELRVAYGFENMKKIAEHDPNLRALGEALEGLLVQPGVTWRGRLPQKELYKEWFRAGIWWYPTDWPETSCITCMDAQACGAIPVTNDYWALKQNVFHGLVFPGIPQQDNYMRHVMIHELCELLQDPVRQEEIRRPMMEEARKTFDWDVFARQLANWHVQDHTASSSEVSIKVEDLVKGLTAEEIERGRLGSYTYPEANALAAKYGHKAGAAYCDWRNSHEV